MANAYANLGQQIGDILGKATTGGGMSARGYQEGVDTGSSHMLRSAQSRGSMADAEKVLYELGLAKKADAITGPQIATSMGVPAHMVEALSRGETSTPALPGPQGPALPEGIPQAMSDKFTNASTLKVLQQLAGGTGSGGTADSLMAALLKGQDLGTMSNMQSGAQETGDVATMQAAMEGKFPGSTGAGGGSTASKVQEMRSLTSKYEGMGMGEKEAHDAALLSVYGDPENEAWTKAFTRAYQSTYSVKSAIKAADASVARMSDGGKGGGEDPLGLR